MESPVKSKGSKYHSEEKSVFPEIKLINILHLNVYCERQSEPKYTEILHVKKKDFESNLICFLKINTQKGKNTDFFSEKLIHTGEIVKARCYLKKSRVTLPLIIWNGNIIISF